MEPLLHTTNHPHGLTSRPIGAHIRAVEFSINSLVAEADELVFHRGTWAFRRASGLEPGAGAPKPVEPLGLPAAVQYVDELIASPRTDDVRKQRLGLLRRFLVDCVIDVETHEAQRSLDGLENTPTVVTTSKRWQLSEARITLPTLAHREARVALADAYERASAEAMGLHQARVDGVFRAAQRLGHPTAFASFVSAQVDELVKQADLVLGQSEDAYRDVLAFGLKRLDTHVRLQSVAVHDVERALLAPWLNEAVASSEVWHAATRCLGDLGFSPNATGRILIDQEPRSTHRMMGVFAPRVPDEVRLVLSPESGLSAWGQWMGLWGQAQHHASVTRALPFVERTLGDAAIPRSTGLLFESWVGDAGWLKRYGRLSSAPAQDAARMFALRQLAMLRREAAMWHVDLAAAKNGLTAAVMDEGRERLGKAIGAPVSSATVAELVDARGHRAQRLMSWSLESALHRLLVERFNEDAWRNPAAGRFLLERAARGQAEAAPSEAKALDPSRTSGLELGPAVARRIAVMNS